jgi:hypothetical protein
MTKNKRFDKNSAKKLIENKKKELIIKNSSKVKSNSVETISSSKKISSIILIILMFGSSIGFIFIFSIYYNPLTQQQNQNELPFQQFENEGQIFWGAIKNSQEFLFLNISGFEERRDLEKIANKIKNNTKLNLFVLPDFNSTDKDSILFEIEKSLKGLKIEYKTLILEEELTNDIKNLVFTKTKKVYPNSIIYSNENYNDSKILQYFLIR